MLDYLQYELKDEKFKSDALKDNIESTGLSYLEIVYNLSELGTNEELLEVYAIYKSIPFNCNHSELKKLINCNRQKRINF